MRAAYVGRQPHGLRGLRTPLWATPLQVIFQGSIPRSGFGGSSWDQAIARRCGATPPPPPPLRPLLGVGGGVGFGSKNSLCPNRAPSLKYIIFLRNISLMWVDGCVG